MSPDDWMKKLLSSEDSGVGIGNSADPIMEMAMTMFTSLMALAVQIDNKTEEQKMQAATDAALSKSVDLSSMLPNLKECRVLLNEGKPLLLMRRNSAPLPLSSMASSSLSRCRRTTSKD